MDGLERRRALKQQARRRHFAPARRPRSRIPARPARPGGARAAGPLLSLLFFLVCLVPSGCALPGKLYRVVPAISGQLPPPAGEVELLLRVMQRESPTLHQEQRVALSPSGRFAFEEVDLEVAGHEYSKFYRVYLHRHADNLDRVIWRADVDRRVLAGPIELVCDLERRAELGEPCQVQDPTRQPWLVANGARTFQKLCARCHGTNASGSGPGIDKSAPRAPDLRAIAARRDGRFDRDEIAAWIEGDALPASHAPRQMPVWGEKLSKKFERYAEGDELVGAKLDPVLVYLESIQLERSQTAAAIGSRR